MFAQSEIEYNTPDRQRDVYLLLVLITSVDHNVVMIVPWCQSHKLWLFIHTGVVVPHL